MHFITTNISVVLPLLGYEPSYATHEFQMLKNHQMLNLAPETG